MTSLGQGFSLLMGVFALVMSLWTLHDQSAQILMSDAYTRWIEAKEIDSTNRGTNPSGFALALRESQTRLMQERPHPAYWAPFVMVGKTWSS